MTTTARTEGIWSRTLRSLSTCASFSAITIRVSESEMTNAHSSGVFEG